LPPVAPDQVEQFAELVRPGRVSGCPRGCVAVLEAPGHPRVGEHPTDECLAAGGRRGDDARLQLRVDPGDLLGPDTYAGQGMPNSTLGVYARTAPPDITEYPATVGQVLENRAVA